MSDFIRRTGLQADVRVLVSKLPMPRDGGWVTISPDALGRGRRLIFCDFGPGVGERAVDVDRQGPGVTWGVVDKLCRTIRADVMPVDYDGAADSVPSHLLVAADGQVVLYREWRHGPWKPLEKEESFPLDMSILSDEEEKDEPV